MVREMMRLYLDTSIYSGYYDKVHKHETRLLIQLINDRKIKVVTSELVMDELKSAKDKRKRQVIDSIHDFAEIMTENDAALALVDEYLKSGLLTANHIIDAVHIALATLSQATTVVSHNMKHMVNRQDKFNVVNLRILGKTINILPPKLILDYYEKGKP